MTHRAPPTHLKDDQIYEGDIVSSSYRDVTLGIGGENIVLKGTRMTELIVAHIVYMGYSRFGCGFCDFIFNDLVYPCRVSSPGTPV